MELLIVVVVIAILAAITIVAYNGITAKAKDSSLKSDLTTAAKKLQLERVDTGSFPSSTPKPSYLAGTIQYTGSGNTFCATASKDGRAFYITEAGTVQAGTCTGHTIAGGSDGVGAGEIIANSPIQNVTSAQCAALPVFDGINEGAVRTVTDARGGTTRTYEIAKLADGKCWMLTNLKLSSTSGSITLTPADSDVASNFTLPQLTASGGLEYDLPRAYGPVPGDTGSGATNYGYLYNFSATVAGETRTSLTTGNAPHSICPFNWRLPTGGAVSSDFGQLDIAFGGNGAYTESGPSIEKWQPSGPFRGAFSGFGNGEAMVLQSVTGGLWSASTTSHNPEGVFHAAFSPDGVSPGDTMYVRLPGFGVRCLLN